MEFIKENIKWILGFIVLVVVYIEVKKAIKRAESKKQVQKLLDTYSTSSSTGFDDRPLNFQELADAIHEAIYGSLDSDEKTVIDILNLVGPAGWPKLADAYANNQNYWLFPYGELKTALNQCLNDDDWKKVNYVPI